ncbi:DegT/DnrJ/EryC1/StrS aminotransferase family protein [soil metagenome]
MSFDIPLVEIEVTDADVESVLDCLRSGWLTMGPRTMALEERLGAMVGVEHCHVVCSGTAALHLACHAVGLGPGTEAIVPTTTFVATANAARYVGADVVFADSASPTDGGIDVEAVKAKIGTKTKAVIAVHMWGYPAAVEQLREVCDEHGLALIEDCAEAIEAHTPSGAEVGSVGDIGCFSFFSKKQLAVGEGGMVTTDDAGFAAEMKLLRSHAMTSVTWERHRGHGLGYDITDIGFNYRIDEPRAALALSRLDRLGGDIDRRRAIARRYRENLAGADGVELMYDDAAVNGGSHFAFPVLLADAETRDRVRAGLRDRGVEVTRYPALHRLTAYADIASDADLPNAAEIADRHLCLPIHGSLDDSRVDSVVERLLETLSAG